MLILTVLLTWPGIKVLSKLALVWITPFLPLLLFDVEHKWWNISKIIDYYRFGQYQIYVPNRWLTYAGVFWPSYWAKVSGFFRPTAYLIMALVGLAYLYQLFKQKLTKPLIIYGFGWATAIVWFRYFRAERNEGYVVYAAPLIILFSAWLISQIKTKYYLLSVTAAGLLLTGNLYGQVKSASNVNIRPNIDRFQHKLTSYQSGAKFAVYDRLFFSTGCSISLSLVLDDYQLASTTGYPVGICIDKTCPSKYPFIDTQIVGGVVCNLVDLSSANPQDIQSEGWVLVSPSEVNRMTVEWWKTEPSLQ